MSCCTLEATAIVCLFVSAIAALAGHWKLGVAAPVWDAASILRAHSVAHVSCPDTHKTATGDTRLAVNVLTRSAERWQGQSQAALVHEALGRMRVQDGDFSGALQDIRKAAQVAVKPGVSGVADEVPESVLDSVRARVRVKEAELLLLTGDYLSAIDAVGDSISAGVDHWARPARLRVESMKVLITAAVRMSPSQEELEGVQEVFEKTKDSIWEHADPATKMLIYDVTALLAEARNDLEDTIDALELAIAHCQQAANVGHALKRERDNHAGDAVQAAELAELHSRMSQALRKRGESGDLARAEWHQMHAAELSHDTGTGVAPKLEGCTSDTEEQCLAKIAPKLVDSTSDIEEQAEQPISVEQH